jgi:hypothetical protein
MKHENEIDYHLLMGRGGHNRSFQITEKEISRLPAPAPIYKSVAKKFPLSTKSNSDKHIYKGASSIKHHSRG